MNDRFALTGRKDIFFVGTLWSIPVATLLLLLTVITAAVEANPDSGEIYDENSGDISAYLQLRVNVISSDDGSPSLETRVESYPVLFADMGSRCEFFLKNPRQDIRRGSRIDERVYFKDVTAIRAVSGVALASDQYAIRVYVGNRSYLVRKWTGMAMLRSDIQGGDCRNLRQQDLVYQWPVLQFKIIAANRTVQWLETNLTQIVNFSYNAGKARSLYDDMKKQRKQLADSDETRVERFQRLLAQEQLRANTLKDEQADEHKDRNSDETAGGALEQFRQALEEGTDTHCGLVIEVRNKVVLVQTVVGERWFKRNQLFQKDAASCRFENGVYQEPE